MLGPGEDRATESLLAARDAYNVPETGQRLKSGQKLSDAYLNANLPVVCCTISWESGWPWAPNDIFLETSEASERGSPLRPGNALLPIIGGAQTRMLGTC